MSDDTEPTKEELQNRIDRLEATVQKMMPTRRDALKLGSAAATAGLLGFGTGSAAAAPGDDGDTTLGSSSNRLDTYIDEMDANLVNTGALSTPLEDGSGVGGSRSLDTEYQNTTGHNIKVIVRLTLPSGGGNIAATLQSASSSGLGSSDEQDRFDFRDDTFGSNTFVSLQANVPDGHYYGVSTNSANDATISAWFERGLA